LSIDLDPNPANFQPLTPLAFLEQPDRCEPNEVQVVTAPVLEILGQPTAPVEPCEGPLDHPTSGQDLEALGGVRALDDFDRQS
jgi:hypothetical protein